MDKILSLIAFVIIAGFLGILVWFVQSPDLILVVGLTVALVGYDMYSSAWAKKD